MGRRALRKPDPALELSKHLVTLDQLPRPWDAAVLFGRVAPLEVEVGSGKGLFLQSATAANPDHDFLGIELAERYAQHAAGRLARRAIANGMVVHGDAQRIFHELMADESLTAVHVYFPDPWWKKRHRKRRVMNEAFVQDVERALAIHSKLHFWTDVEEYYQSSVEIIANHTRLVGPLPVEELPAAHDLDFRTHFERRTRLLALPVYRSEFRKVNPQG